MKSQSFEYQLRNAVPPAPGPEARLRARKAALAEFERIHVHDAPAPAPEPRRSAFELLVASLRPKVLGGFASICVVVVAASILFLMPKEQRGPRLNVPITVEPQPKPAPAETQPETPQAAEPPSVEQEKKAATIVRADGTESRQPDVLPPSQPLPGEPRDSAPAVDPSRNEEIAITASRLERRTVDSPTPVVTLGEPTTDRPVPAAPAVANRSKAVAIAGASLGQVNQFAPVPPGLGSRDKFEHFELNPVRRVADDPVSTFSVDVDTASYSFVRRQLNEGGLPPVDAVRVEEMINYFDYAWPAPDSREQPFKPTITVSDSPWGEGKKLVHIGIKGYALPVAQQPDVNLVLLLDVSGSMNEPDKLPLAQQSMALLLDSLKPTDTVAIVVYAGAAGEVLAPTPVRQKETILDALRSLRPGGSTAGAAGVRLAYELAEKSFRKNGVNRILLATDGDFNVGITDRDELKGFVQREREKGVFLSVLGFGEGNYRDEIAQALAQNGNGVAAYIDTLSEAKKVLVQEATAALFTIAKDVKLQVEFNPATVAEYRLVGYETRALEREDFNNDKVDAGDVGSGHTVTAIYEITPTDSKARLVDESRYGPREQTPTGRSGARANELGYLKIRYKLPNESHSRLLQEPILVNTGVPRALARDVDFSTAVAGFAQLLRGGRYTGALRFEDVLQQAKDTIGADPHGYRAEFVELVRRAQRVQENVGRGQRE